MVFFADEPSTGDLACHRSATRRHSTHNWSHHQLFKHALVDEQGSEPGAALSELHQQILCRDPHLAAKPAGRHPRDWRDRRRRFRSRQWNSSAAARNWRS